MKKGTYCVMIDCSRNGVMNVGALKRFIKIIADMGYNALMLYTEDVYEVEGEEYFGLFRGRYTSEEIAEIHDFAAACGVELIPCIQTLAHLDTLLRWHAYEDVRDCDDCLLVDEDKTYGLIERMICSVSKHFKSKRLHLGLDEAYSVGKGKYFERHGHEKQEELFARHCEKVAQIAQKHGFSPIIWGDIAVNCDVNINGCTVCWDYYTEDAVTFEEKLLSYKGKDGGVWYAGGIITWLGYAPYNRFSSGVIDTHISVCKKHSVDNFIVTLWGDDGKECSYFSALPALFSAIKNWKGEVVEESKPEFESITGVAYDDMLLLDCVNDVGEDIKWQNPNKYLLYQDVLLGIYDSTVDKSIYPRQFAKTAQMLDSCAKKGVFSYLFEAASALCRVLEIKSVIGIKTREAYRKGSKDELKRLFVEYGELKKRIEEFYYLFKSLWYNENKGVGFEVIDIRLGGLLARVSHASELISDFVEGKIAKVDELEEKSAVYYSSEFIGKAVYAPKYRDIVTANRL